MLMHWRLAPVSSQRPVLQMRVAELLNRRARGTDAQEVMAAAWPCLSLLPSFSLPMFSLEEQGGRADPSCFNEMGALL